nr:hypothetical protein [Tanacetum cinerariifolium]
PVLLLQGGKDTGEGSISGLRYVNTRGVAFEGTVDQRLGFYGFLTDNQEAVPGWVQQRTRRDRIVPHEGYWKDFKTVGGSAYDFFTARGGITYAATKHINVQFAHDRNFIGNGYRSLILSDYSAPYFFLKLNTRVWKFNYQNVFAELTAGRTYNDAGSPTDSLFPKKYLALHHLSLDVTDNFNIGVFESEVSGGPGRGLELQYLNPVIFYRAIEQQVGSTDNALLAGIQLHPAVYLPARVAVYQLPTLSAAPRPPHGCQPERVAQRYQQLRQQRATLLQHAPDGLRLPGGHWRQKPPAARRFHGYLPAAPQSVPRRYAHRPSPEHSPADLLRRGEWQ